MKKIIHAHWEIIATHNGCTLDYDCICSNCQASGTPGDEFCPSCKAKMDRPTVNHTTLAY